MINIIMVAAVSANNVIGKDGKIPWYVPEDLKRFKKLTSYNPVIMGRKTYESIIDSFGKPLENRLNIVLTRQNDYKAEPKVMVSNSLDDVIVKFWNYPNLFILGGQKVYEDAMPIANKLEITEIHKIIKNGDTFFPKIDKNIWEEQNRIKSKEYDFVTYTRKED